MSFQICELNLKELKEVAKDLKIPVSRKTKCELIILLERAGYGEEYIYYPPLKEKIVRKKKSNVKQIENDRKDLETIPSSIEFIPEKKMSKYEQKLNSMKTHELLNILYEKNISMKEINKLKTKEDLIEYILALRQ